MFKRILLTAVLGGGLLLTVPGAAQANSHASDSHKIVRHDHPTQSDNRPDWWGDPTVGVFYGRGAYGLGAYGPYVSPFVAPRLIFTGFDNPPDYYYDGGYGNRYCDDYYSRHGYRRGYYPYGYDACDEYDYRTGYC